VKNTLKTFNSGRAITFMMVFICCILVAAVLKLASTVILPFIIAVLLAFAMFPLINLLDKYKIPRFVSIFLIVLIIGTGLYVIGRVLFSSGMTILHRYPLYEVRLTNIYKWAAELFDLPFDEDQRLGDILWGQLGIRTWVFETTRSLSNSLIRFITTAGLVIIFMVFILMEASYFKNKLETAFGDRSNRINQMGLDVMTQITKYLTAKFLISLANGIIFAVSFYFIGLEFAIVWGVLQFFLNFIPTLGSIVAGLLISLFALMQFWPEPGPVILVVAVVLGVNIILGNILDPKIIGEHVGISPLLILVSLALWGYIWGFAGMVIAVPMTVIIKIICENIPFMEPVAVLIGSKKSVNAKKAEHEKSEFEKTELLDTE
jgi:predicted PurR-regulated permease PerM